MPAYYRNALAFNEMLLSFYFVVCFALIGISAHQWDWEPVAFFVVTIVVLLNGHKMNARINSVAYAAISIAWCWWHNEFLGRLCCWCSLISLIRPGSKSPCAPRSSRSGWCCFPAR